MHSLGLALPLLTNLACPLFLVALNGLSLCLGLRLQMDHQPNADAILADIVGRIRGIISKERANVQLQASKLSMRFKSTTRWELLDYPFVIPESVSISCPNGLGSFPNLTMALTRLTLQVLCSRTLPSQTSPRKSSSKSSQRRRRVRHSSLAPSQ